MDVNSCSRVTVQCHCLSEANTSIFRNRSLSSFQATSSDLNWKVEQVSCTIFYSATASTSLLSSSPSGFFFLKLICFASTLWRLSCFRSRKCIPQGTPFPLTSKLHLYPVGQTASFVPFPWSGNKKWINNFYELHTMTNVSFCVNSWTVAESSTRIPSAPSKLKVDLTVHLEGWLVTQCLFQTSVSSYKIEMLWSDQQVCRLPGKFGSKVMSQKRPPWLRLGRSLTTSGGIVCGEVLHMSHTDPSNSRTQRRKISACFLKGRKLLCLWIWIKINNLFSMW